MIIDYKAGIPSDRFVIGNCAAVRDGRVLPRDGVHRHFWRKGKDSGAPGTTGRTGSARRVGSIGRYRPGFSPVRRIPPL